jgi:hypothetical protein
VAIKALILFLLTTSNSYSASCCGGGGSMPNIITGDNKAQISATVSNAAYTHHADENGKIESRYNDNKEVSETISISSAYLISELSQIGITVPFKYNTHKTNSTAEKSKGLGDLRFQYAYEFLPEYSFSYWKPRGFLFIEQFIPTSKSTYTATKPLRTDSMGKGFFTTAIGFSFNKVISYYDYNFLGEYHYSFEREFDDIKVSPKGGASTMISLGLTPYLGSFRFGTSLLYSNEFSTKVEGGLISKSSNRYFYELGLTMSYFINDYSIGLNYSDQTFLGTASNTSLSKSLAITLLKSFSL